MGKFVVKNIHQKDICYNVIGQRDGLIHGLKVDPMGTPKLSCLRR
jgi:hypothetical protein